MLRDALNRPLQDLRISVTDRCNFRCLYCMPEDRYEWIDRREILSFEEITRVATAFVAQGVRRIRLTGGEPLLRRELHRLVAGLAAIPGLSDLSLTTNGSLLARQAGTLAAAGLRRVNVSLDSLDPEKFRRITRKNELPVVLDGIEVARKAGLTPIKINAVIERGVNDDEILDLVEFARTRSLSLRLIEFMDVGNSNKWRSDRMVSKQEMLEVIRSRYPLKAAGRTDDTAPAVDHIFEDGMGDLGVIASVTEPFCGACSRARLTADGRLVTCLFSATGLDLKAPVRAGISVRDLAGLIGSAWTTRTDRYSEERLTAMNSAGGYAADAHRKIEMISLGG
jgi:GTP 3',8-cyclase